MPYPRRTCGSPALSTSAPGQPAPQSCWNGTSRDSHRPSGRVRGEVVRRWTLSVGRSMSGDRRSLLRLGFRASDFGLPAVSIPLAPLGECRVRAFPRPPPFERKTKADSPRRVFSLRLPSSRGCRLGRPPSHECPRPPFAHIHRSHLSRNDQKRSPCRTASQPHSTPLPMVSPAKTSGLET